MNRSVLLGAAGFLTAISWQVVIPVLPLHLSRIGYTASQVGLLASLISLATGLVELQVGRIVAALGRRWTLIAGIVANAACMILVAQARAAGAMAASLAAVGGARATLSPPLQAAVADTASSEARGRAFGVFWFWTSVSFLTGPALGGLVAALYGDRMAFYLGSAFGLLALPIVIAVTGSGRSRLGRTRPSAPAPSPWEVLKDRTILQLCLANHLYYSFAGIWTTFLPLYMASQGLSVAIVGWVFTIQGLTYALVQIPAGRLADRVGPGRLIIPGMIGRGLVSLLAPLYHAPATFLIAGAIYGFAGGVIPVTFTAHLPRLVPRQKYTTAMGVYNSSGDLGFFVGPALGGVAAVSGLAAPFYLTLPLAMAAVVIGMSGLAAAERSQDAG